MIPAAKRLRYTVRAFRPGAVTHLARGSYGQPLCGKKSGPPLSFGPDQTEHAPPYPVCDDCQRLAALGDEHQASAKSRERER